LQCELGSCITQELEGKIAMAEYFTINGDSNSCQGMTCEAYVRQQWGDVGLNVLRTLSTAFQQSTRSYNAYTTLFRLRLTDGQATAYIDGVDNDLATQIKIVETLAWICATFRLPDTSSETPKCSYVDVFQDDLVGGIQIALRPLRDLSLAGSTSCWQTLLPKSVIACGFSEVSKLGDGLALPLMLCWI